MKRVTIPLTLIVKGPVLTKSSSIGRIGIDAVMAEGRFRNPKTEKVEKRYYLPGTLVKGLLREAWWELAAADDRFWRLTEEYLGAKSAAEATNDPGTNDPRRGRLLFSDFADRGEHNSIMTTRYRIAIDEERGAVDAGKLQMAESPYAPGEEIEFVGEARLLVTEGEDASQIADAVHRGLLWVMAAGGVRTSGFGEIRGVRKDREKTQVAPQGLDEMGARWRISLTFDQPVVFARRRISENLFESSKSIPGAAIKGAVGQMLARVRGEFAELEQELHLVRFTQAVPAEKGKPLPEQWPLSLLSFQKDVRTGDKFEVVDAVRCREPFWQGDKAGAFDIDWKDDEWRAVETRYDWPGDAVLQQELRVRTGISGEHRRADESKLFAYWMLSPFGVEWTGEVDASRLGASARTQLEQILRMGVEPLGKTKALGRVDLSSAPLPTVKAAPDYVLTLQTPALLLDPSREMDYPAVWNRLSEGALEMVNFFHRTRLAGGDYVQKRFHPKRPQYKPYLLTEAGSTFLLKPVAGREEDARKWLEEWARHGLPLSQQVRTFYEIGDTPDRPQWKQCPYLPENGYGEIRVNSTARFPEAEECTKIR